MKAYLFILTYYFRILGKFSPQAAGDKLFKLAQRTRKLKFKPAEKAFYAEAHRFTAPFYKGDIPCYEMGDINGPLVVLVHGWESNAGSMSGAGNILANLGYHVISFDLPAHGNHGGTHTNLLECKQAFSAVIERIKPAHPFSIVAHSFGTAVSSMALTSGYYNVDRLVLLSTTNALRAFFEPLKKMLKVEPKTYQHILKNVERILDTSIDEIQLEKFAPELGVKDFTIIHDEFDKILPYSNAERVASTHSEIELLPIQKAGHYRMLWNDEVFDLIAQTFVDIDKPKKVMGEAQVEPSPNFAFAMA